MKSAFHTLLNRKTHKHVEKPTSSGVNVSRHNPQALDPTHQTNETLPPHSSREITLSPESISSYLSLVKRSPEIIPWIDKLTLEERLIKADTSNSPHETWDAQKLLTFIDTLRLADPSGHERQPQSAKLPSAPCNSITSLVLRNWTLSPTIGVMGLLVSRFRNVHTLTIDHVNLGVVDTLVCLYYIFPQLHTLEINSVILTPNVLENKIPYPTSQVSRLSSLTFTYSKDIKHSSLTINEMISALLPTPHYWNLHTLNLSRLLADDIVYVQTLLSHVGPKLQNLRIDGRAAFRSYATDSYPLRLHNCKSLQTLTIVDLPLHPDLGDKQHGEDLTALLSGISSPWLRVLRFQFLSAIEDTDLEYSKAWDRIWELVCGPNLSNAHLGGLRVEVGIPAKTEDTQGVVEENPPAPDHRAQRIKSIPWHTLAKSVLKRAPGTAKATK